jgi:hypothetical protein
MRILGIVALGAALGGCASSSEDIMPAYVSPVAYQTYTCQQLALEAQSISTRAATLSGVQDGQRTKDQWCERLDGMGAADGLHARLEQAEMLHLAFLDQVLDRAGDISASGPKLITSIDRSPG